MPSNKFSRFRGAIWQGFWRSIYGQETGIQGQIDDLIGQGRLLVGRSRLLHFVPSERNSDPHIFVRSGTLAAAQADLHLANRRRNLSVVESFSRAVSIPSISGPSFQVCGYHIDCLQSRPSKVSGISSQKSLMAGCGSRLAHTECSIGNLSPRHVKHGAASYHSSCVYKRSSAEYCRSATMSFRNKEQPNNFLLYGYFIYNGAKRKGSSNPFLGFGFERSYLSSPVFSSSGTAPEVSFEKSVKEEQRSTSAVSSELNSPIIRALKLNSGSCYLPHPDKEETGGEDAHFICLDEQAIGVADGVGGWADLGVDAGLYARELMSHSVNAIQEEPRGSVDPARVLEKAYTSTRAKGSSTACIIALTGEGLQAINLGDSGFMVVRDGSTVFRSPVQQHDFNFTYQLECGSTGDLPSSGQVFTIPVAPGDVIIAGTDGLFDNLYSNDITAVVVQATRASLKPQVTAQKIAALARQRAQDKNRQTPFSAAAQEAGFRYYGGKLDDITVVVSYITSDHKDKLSSKSSD
ncbi:probable protein phosphatase 2C 55 [Salvia splendens]|uniref:probable protein phosphatase 2C 55 n=1 Tax=Salvia splendens TaxID=180675 RepID=UPI001C25F399|nr:probable protein phosphatase 2C 55 [Salvia splendens]XP_042006538.1 probable protein phosphatase 2C 55 [Salvia splendens]XP_042006539.1 probable protein phosphatase 2C 55 [Salvia splendens]XP_042006540.1 probable protein phosphatase 2C 55 [Salvia splendens]XP_042006541.1 probable protein phosphatase 2C 55 [Salvia splendens]